MTTSLAITLIKRVISHALASRTGAFAKNGVCVHKIASLDTEGANVQEVVACQKLAPVDRIRGYAIKSFVQVKQ